MVGAQETKFALRIAVIGGGRASCGQEMLAPRGAPGWRGRPQGTDGGPLTGEVVPGTP